VRLIQYGNDCGNTFHSLFRRIGESPRGVSTEKCLLFSVLALPVGAAYLAGFLLGVANLVLSGRIQITLCRCGGGNRVSLPRGGIER
jgi:hypothetical protein